MKFFSLLASFVLMAATGHAPAQSVTINNGVEGDGAWNVSVQAGGDSGSGELDPSGELGPTNVIFNLSTLVESGGSALSLSDTSIAQEPVLSAPGQVSSGGHYEGPNGRVQWSAVSTIAPGSTTYNNTVSFSSDTPFGDQRVYCYLDEDVLGASNDLMVLFGTPGAADFNVLTVDSVENVGVAHAAGYLSATNATYIGWAADQFSNLISDIFDGTATFSIPGVIDTASLPPTSDPRYPGRPAYGPEDITNAFAFRLDANATSAQISCSLGGLPTGRLPTLAIAKSAAATARIGTDLVYTITYSNSGSAASGVVVRDRLPAGASFVSASDGGTLEGDTVVWNIGDLPADGSNRALTLTVRVTGIAGMSIRNEDYVILAADQPTVSGAAVVTLLTPAVVEIPPVTPTAGFCATVPLPDAIRQRAFDLSSDARYVLIDTRSVDPVDNTPIFEIGAYDRQSGSTRALTSGNLPGPFAFHPLSGNRAFVFYFPLSGFGQTGPLPFDEYEILLVDIPSGDSMPVATPFRTAAEAEGLDWAYSFVAAADGGNHLVLDESAYDEQGVLVDSGLHFVNLAMQTSFDLLQRIVDASDLPDGSNFFFGAISSGSLAGNGGRFAFSSNIVLTGTDAGTRVNQLPGNVWGIRNLAYVLDIASNDLTLVAEPDYSVPRPPGGSSLIFTRGLGATGALVTLDRQVPFFGTPGNPERNSEIYVAQPGIAIDQITSTGLPRSGDYFSPALAHITPNERYVYFDAQQDLVGANPDQSHELFRFDIQTGEMRQVTLRFDAFADLLASLGLSPASFQSPVQLSGYATSFDGRHVLLLSTGVTTIDLGGGASGVFNEPATLYDCDPPLPGTDSQAGMEDSP